MSRSWRTGTDRIVIRPTLAIGLAVALCGGILLPGGALAQEKLAGEWHALLKTPSGEQRIVLDLDLAVGGIWSGTVTDLETNEGEIELTALNVTAETVSFNFQARSLPYPGSFWGNYNPATDQLSGTFSFGGRSLPMSRFERQGGPVVASAEGETETPRVLKHARRFGVCARAVYWLPIHVVKDDVRNINDVTAGRLNYDLSFRWYAMDAFAIWGRYYIGGLGFDSKPSWVNEFAYLGLTENSFLDMRGWELGFNAYFGQALTPNSRFNPYVTASAGQVSWRVRETKGGQDIAIDDVNLQGVSPQYALGLGTEYAFGERWALEFEWAWKFARTEDKTKWPNSEEEWTNTTYWTLAAGIVFMF